MKATFTIIDDEHVKGLLVLGVSKEEIEKIIDIVELSTPEEEAETERLVRDADEKNAWIPWGKVRAEAGEVT